MVYQKFRFFGDLVVIQQYKKGIFDVEYAAHKINYFDPASYGTIQRTAQSVSKFVAQTQ